MKPFTTGEVARICQVSPRTICKWFDTGKIRGYRIPGGGDRRIPRDSLVKFLEEHGMSMADVPAEETAEESANQE